MHVVNKLLHAPAHKLITDTDEDTRQLINQSAVVADLGFKRPLQGTKNRVWVTKKSTAVNTIENIRLNSLNKFN